MTRMTLAPLSLCISTACFYQPTGHTPPESGTSGAIDSTDVAGETPADTMGAADPTSATAIPTTTDDPGASTGASSSASLDTTSDVTTVADDTSSVTDTDAPPACGDGVQNGSEECDDGNNVEGDGCEPGCVVTAVCGNGHVESGEVCDDGNTDDSDMCSADCLQATTEAICGNGTVESPESCDDGNNSEADGCEPSCEITLPECGDAVRAFNEECDDGNAVNGGPGDFCKTDCTLFVPQSCAAPKTYTVCDDGVTIVDKSDKANVHRALGICDGLPGDSVQITDFVFNSKNNAAWQVARGYGSYVHDHDLDAVTPDRPLFYPREGDALLMLSTGVITAPNKLGIVVEGPNSQGGQGDNGNPDDDLLPAPLHSEAGSNSGAGGTPFQHCAEVGDCSDTLQAQWDTGNGDPNDKLWFTFKAEVPGGTFGYSFDMVLCSSEWPQFVGTAYNDIFTVYQVDPSADNPNADPPVDPYVGNVTHIDDPNDPNKALALSITALDSYFAGPGYSLHEPQLAGTGFETHACTDWLRVEGGVGPGAIVELGFFHADLADSLRATVVLLDNFRWSCGGCVPTEIDDCGVQDL